MPNTEFNPEDLFSVKPPVVIAAANAALLSAFPNGEDHLWQADIKVVRHDLQCTVFKNILFVESGGTAFIYGIEHADGYPKGLIADRALKQQEFLNFLRAENEADHRALGIVALLFAGHDYASEAKATAAFLKLRDENLNMGIGYFNADGVYVLEAIDPTDDWMPLARSIVPYGELGVCIANSR